MSYTYLHHLNRYFHKQDFPVFPSHHPQTCTQHNQMYLNDSKGCCLLHFKSKHFPLFFIKKKKIVIQKTCCKTCKTEVNLDVMAHLHIQTCFHQLIKKIIIIIITVTSSSCCCCCRFVRNYSSFYMLYKSQINEAYLHISFSFSLINRIQHLNTQISPVQSISDQWPHCDVCILVLV